MLEHSSFCLLDRLPGRFSIPLSVEFPENGMLNMIEHDRILIFWPREVMVHQQCVHTCRWLTFADGMQLTLAQCRYNCS